MPSVGAWSPPGHSASSRSSSSRARAAVTGSPSTSDRFAARARRPGRGGLQRVERRDHRRGARSPAAAPATGGSPGRAAPRRAADRSAGRRPPSSARGRRASTAARTAAASGDGMVGAQLAHAVADAADRDVGVALGPLAGARSAAAGSALIELGAGQRPQPGDRQPDGPRQHRRLDRREHVVRGLAGRPAQLGGDRPGPRPVQPRRRPARPGGAAAAAAAWSTAPTAAWPPSASSSGPAPARRGRTPTRPRRAARPPTPPTPRPAWPRCRSSLAGPVGGQPDDELRLERGQRRLRLLDPLQLRRLLLRRHQVRPAAGHRAGTAAPRPPPAAGTSARRARPSAARRR